MDASYSNGFATDAASKNGFWDAFGRISDTAVSVIGVVKGNKAQEQAAEQQTAVARNNSSNVFKIVAVVAAVVLTLGLAYVFLRPKKG